MVKVRVPRARKGQSLSAQQARVAQAWLILLEGTVEDVAHFLQMSPEGVKNSVKLVYLKLDVHTRAQFVRAMMERIQSPPARD